METAIELSAPYAPPLREHPGTLRTWLRALSRARGNGTPQPGKRSSSATLLHTESRPKTLDDLGKGESGIIAKIHGSTSIRLHLMEMGLTPGTTITVGRVAVLGGPFDLTVRGYRLSLRREEARAIELTVE